MDNSLPDFTWELPQNLPPFGSPVGGGSKPPAGRRAEAGPQAERLRELEFSLHRVALASQAMWELVRGRLELSDADLLAKMNEIDLRDGAKDERMSTRPASCSKCNRTSSTKNSRCIYCGNPLPKPHVFQ